MSAGERGQAARVGSATGQSLPKLQPDWLSRGC